MTDSQDANTATDNGAVTSDDVANRVFGSVVSAFEALSVYVGDRMGWYESLAATGTATPTELAERTGSNLRYTTEWLEMQAVYGLLEVEDGTADSAAAQPADRRYRITAAVAEVMTDEHSLAYLGRLPGFVVAFANQMDGLLRVYREGGGVTWAEQGDDARETQAAVNRPVFEHQLPGALSQIDRFAAVVARPGASVADIGCGTGWSTLALARAYPGVRFVGLDVDQPSIDAARRNLADAARDSGDSGLAERVEFQLADGENASRHGPFDAAVALECIHDMARPVDVLRAARESLRPDGVMVVMDEAVADEFTAPGDDVERFMYGCSVFCCLPDAMSSEPSAATGTVMRASTLLRYATEAGFSIARVADAEPISFFRFYELVR
jgi:SAM-dependent methyltransferase